MNVYAPVLLAVGITLTAATMAATAQQPPPPPSTACAQGITAEKDKRWGASYKAIREQASRDGNAGGALDAVAWLNFRTDTAGELQASGVLPGSTAEQCVRARLQADSGIATNWPREGPEKTNSAGMPAAPPPVPAYRAPETPPGFPQPPPPPPPSAMPGPAYAPAAPPPGGMTGGQKLGVIIPLVVVVAVVVAVIAYYARNDSNDSTFDKTTGRPLHSRGALHLPPPARGHASPSWVDALRLQPVRTGGRWSGATMGFGTRF